MPVLFINVPDDLATRLTKPEGGDDRPAADEVLQLVRQALAAPPAERLPTGCPIPDDDGTGPYDGPPYLIPDFDLPLSGLSRIVEPLPGGQLRPTPPILTDECPAPRTIPLAGPSVVVEPLSGGQLRPTPPIFLDVEKQS